MKSMKNIAASLCFPLALLFCACQDVIELNLSDVPPQLVVEGWITNLEKPAEVIISYSTNYLDRKALPRASGAEVALHDENGLVAVFEESDEQPGVYRSDYVGQVGVAYHLRIRTPDGKRYASIPELLKGVSPITAIYYEFRQATLFQEEGYYVKIDSYEPEGPGDYYRWRQFINDTLNNRPIDILVVSDQFVDGNDIIGFEINFQPLKLGDRYRVEQMSISRRAYEFFFLVREQTAFVGGLFDTPPAPIKGNLYNVDDPNEQVLGFFGASGVSIAEIIIE
jgi:hypothetical protein